jgi:hypothetical protein
VAVEKELRDESTRIRTKENAAVRAAKTRAEGEKENTREGTEGSTKE